MDESYSNLPYFEHDSFTKVSWNCLLELTTSQTLSYTLSLSKTTAFQLSKPEHYPSTDVHCRDEFGRTAMHNAILGKQLHLMEILLDKGADVQMRDERGDTALHTAVRTGDEMILQVHT